METNTTGHAALSLVSAEQRPDLVPAFAALSAPVWPTFLDGDRAIVDCWDVDRRGYFTHPTSASSKDYHADRRRSWVPFHIQ